MKTSYYRHNKPIKKSHPILSGRISFNELTFVIKGNLKYVIDGTAIKVNAGDCIYLPAGCLRQREPAELTDYVSFNFGNAPKIQLPTLIENCLNGEINLLITLCDELYSKYFDWNDKIDTTLELIIKLLGEKISSNEENPTIVHIKRYVQKNLSKKLTLKQIANSVGYSPNYCDTLFKSHTGVSILNYVIERRISEAKLLLSEGILSLKEISETIGFEDYNYFSRTFKKKSGYSPSEYKSARLNHK